MQIELMSAITLGAVILGAIVNIVGLVSKREAQVTSEAKRDVKLDMLISQSAEVVKTQKSIERRLEEHDKQLLTLEGRVEATAGCVETLCQEHKDIHYSKPQYK
jgi:TolA-binding protein